MASASPNAAFSISRSCVPEKLAGADTTINACSPRYAAHLTEWQARSSPAIGQAADPEAATSPENDTRPRDALRIVGKVAEWTGHSPRSLSTCEIDWRSLTGLGLSRLRIEPRRGTWKICPGIL